ncbi:hypothetical protein BN1012_Phect1320 [Candidatus Phaeomarinobacter ectocarpi]|uniref:Uncharacterized protein n=1 Tax=Candidatus Phaeomarinibacter ectocarpi TaxID=1458461 RepID=X5MEY7_9HYPH|nr:hypothetical protein [Candidatus Phaeomarinobacter ectocarpi]CDO59534.1 hypothetical protein BN1012_Phect1320 [Candidatus Phaeomarinobacter ectocarpi]
MALPITSSLIAAQAQTYAAPKNVRAYAPPPVEKLAARGSSNAVQVEISAEARKAEQARFETRNDDDKRADERRDAADARTNDLARDLAREFAREAPLRDAQQNAGTRNSRPGTNLDIQI